MNKKIHTKIFYILLIMTILLLFTGCSKTEKQSKTGFNKVKWEGIWEHKYNTKDIAQVRISNETEDGFDFGLFIAEYREDDFLWQGGFSCYINKQDNTTAKFSIDRMNFGKVQTDGSLEKAEGVIFINPQDNELIIKYDEIEMLSETYNTQLPTNYKRAEQDRIESAIYSMPFNRREPHMRNTFKINSIETANSVFGEPKEITNWAAYREEDPDRFVKIIYSDTELVMYYPKGLNKIGGLSWCVTSRQDLIFLRGIKIGDSMESVIKKFPDEGNKIINDYRGIVRPLYGTFVNSGTIFYLENHVEIGYSDEIISYGFIFDENNKLVKVRIGVHN